MADARTSGKAKTADGCRPDSLFGVWAIAPGHLEGWVEAARSIDLTALKAASPGAQGGVASPYEMLPGGIARIHIVGPMTKYPTSFQEVFGGISSLLTREAVRLAARDKDVKGIMLRIDSPGGTSAGTGDLADAVREAAKRKPVHAYVEDMAGSAAYWVASQASRVTVNETGWAGSIGTFSVLRDTSGAHEAAGVKVHVVSSGGVKGAGAEGVPITGDVLSEVKRIVDQVTALFTQAVARGRGLPIARVREMADGRTHVGAQAVELGLVDAVATPEAALRQLVKETVMSADDTTAAIALAEEQQARAERLEQELAETKAQLEALKAPAAAANPLAGISAEARAMIEAAQRDAAEAKAALAQVSAAQRASTFAALAGELKLPAEAAGILDVVEAAAGAEAFGKLRGYIQALGAQVTESTLFGEQGTTAAAHGSATAYDEMRARAQKLVADGTVKTIELGIAHVITSDPKLYARHVAEQEGN